MRFQKMTLTLVLACGTALLAGCGGGGPAPPETAPVSGSVMFEGKAVEGATVSFMAEGAPRAATGVTDAEGKFELSTYEPKDGAMIGEHVVTITKVEGGNAPAAGSSTPSADPSAMLGNYQEQADKGFQGPKQLLPAKYADKATSPLKEKVTKEGPNKFVFQLTK